MPATPAAFVVVVHHARADRREARRHTTTDGRNHSAGLVPRNHRSVRLSQWRRSTVVAQVAPAHAGCLDGEDHFTLAGRRVRKILQYEFSIAKKDDAAHAS